MVRSEHEINADDDRPTGFPDAEGPGPGRLAIRPMPDETIAANGLQIWNRERRPSEVLEACLTRIAEREPRVRAWAVVDRDGARAQAGAFEGPRSETVWRGPLHGIPIGIKDIIDVAGLPTACGASRWKDRTAAADAPIVARLRRAGAIIVGKTVTTPYAWVDPPPTRNPWDLDRTPGGSSSGSAAALACGMVLGAIGTQTGGSITRPASFCGVCGLKPTYGRLPVEGILPFAPSLDHPGPLARTIADLELLWMALADRDAREARTAGPRGAAVRLGRLRGLFDEQAEPVIREAFERALEALRGAGVVVRDAPPKCDFDAVLTQHRIIMSSEASAVHESDLRAHPEDYPPRITALIEEGLGHSAAVYLRAKEHQAAMKRAIEASFEGVDALVTPAALGPAPGPETTGDPVFNSPWSYTGLPTVTLPMGLSPDGLPLGMQLIGRVLGEWDLLRVARRCEAVFWG